MNIISEYVAPWALPKEDIPIHFFWEPEPELDTIILEMSSDFSVVEVFNADKYSWDEERARLTIDCSSLKSNNYFSLVIRSSRKSRKTLVRSPIRVSFVSRGRVLMSRVLEATVVRPKLKIIKAPDNLVIDDNVNPKNLFNMTLAHLGLGTTEVRIRVTARGQTVSRTDSLYLEILQELYEDILGVHRDEEEEEPVAHGFRLDERWLKATAEEITRQIRRGHIPPEMREEAAQEVLQLLADDKERERILKAIYSRLRRLLLGALLYYTDRYPEEEIDLPYGRIRTIFQSEVKSLRVRFNYKDSIGNRYSPIQQIIDIDDRRTNKEKIFQAPINITWKRESLEI